MRTLEPEERERLLAALAQSLRQRSLNHVALLLARSLSGLGVVVSHVLLLAQPLTPSARWQHSLGAYAEILEEPESWQTLIHYLEASDS